MDCPYLSLLGKEYTVDWSTSIYSHMNLPSASSLSDIPPGIFSDIVQVSYGAVCSNEAAFSSLVNDHNGTCSKVIKFIDELCADSLKTFHGQIDTGLQCIIDSKAPLLCKINQRPDINYIYVSKPPVTFLLSEVHSIKHNNIKDDYEATIRKLSVGLAEQLRCLRQIDAEICSISGYYFPVKRSLDQRTIERVNCMWDESRLQFIGDIVQFHTMQELKLDIKDVFLRQYSMCSQLKLSQTINSAILPLTPAFVKNFGQDAIQLPSGESFVVKSQDKIYKLPLRYEHVRTLSRFKRQEYRKCGGTVSLPFDSNKTICDFDFFIFQCYCGPLNKTTVLTIMKLESSRTMWLKGVVQAIKDFHSCDVAHLDIRLPNICYTVTGEPILIDIDRSAEKRKYDDKKYYALLESKYNSHMYSTSEFFDNENVENNIFKLDWKQLAIMLLHISNRYPNIYAIKPDLKSAPRFLQELYNRGNFDETLFQTFLNDPQIYD